MAAKFSSPEGESPMQNHDGEYLEQCQAILNNKNIKILDVEKSLVARHEEVLLINGIPINLNDSNDNSLEIKKFLVQGKIPPAQMLTDLLFEIGIIKKKEIEIETNLEMTQSERETEKIYVENSLGQIVDEKFSVLNSENLVKSEHSEIWQSTGVPNEVSKQGNKLGNSKQNKDIIKIDQTSSHNNELNNPSQGVSSQNISVVQDSLHNSFKHISTTETNQIKQNTKIHEYHQTPNNVNFVLYNQEYSENYKTFQKIGDDKLPKIGTNSENSSQIGIEHRSKGEKIIEHSRATEEVANAGEISLENQFNEKINEIFNQIQCINQNYQKTALNEINVNQMEQIVNETNENETLKTFLLQNQFLSNSKNFKLKTSNKRKLLKFLCAMKKDAQPAKTVTVASLPSTSNTKFESHHSQQSNLPNHLGNSVVYQDSQLISAPLATLIQQLAPTFEYIPSDQYIFTFLLCSRLFIKPVELLQEICKICEEQQNQLLHNINSTAGTNTKIKQTTIAEAMQVAEIFKNLKFTENNSKHIENNVEIVVNQPNSITKINNSSFDVPDNLQCGTSNLTECSEINKLTRKLETENFEFRFNKTQSAEIPNIQHKTYEMNETVQHTNLFERPTSTTDQQTCQIRENLKLFAKNFLKFLNLWIRNFPYDFRDENLMKLVREMTRRCCSYDLDLRKPITEMLKYLLQKLLDLEKYEKNIMELEQAEMPNLSEIHNTKNIKLASSSEINMKSGENTEMKQFINTENSRLTKNSNSLNSKCAENVSKIFRNTKATENNPFCGENTVCNSSKFSEISKSTENCKVSICSNISGDSAPSTKNSIDSNSFTACSSSTSSNYEKNQLTFFDILSECPIPLKMAEQLTHLELERLSFIGAEEFIQVFKNDGTKPAQIIDPGRNITERSGRFDSLEKRTRNLEIYAQWFNRLSYLVATEIVKYPKKKRRVRIIEYWIETARECFNIGNFNSLMAIIAGLNMLPISRLRKTWAKVQLAKFSVLEHQMDPSNNFLNYRSTLKAAIWRSNGAQNERERIIIPFFSILLKDLYFLNEGCSNRLPNGHINFEKFWQLSKQIHEFIQWKQVECPFTRDENLIQVLQTNQILNENALALASFECEPPDNQLEKESYKVLRMESN